MSKKKALEKGKNQGELIRLKQTLRKQNEIIVRSKKKDAEGGASTPGVVFVYQGPRHDDGHSKYYF